MISSIVSGTATIQARAKRLKTLRNIKVDDAGSHSTDYGLEHCRELMNEKNNKKDKEADDQEHYLMNYDSEQEEQQEHQRLVVNELGDDEESKSNEPTIGEGSPEQNHFQGLDSILMDNPDSTELERSRSRSRSPPKRAPVPHSFTMDNAGVSNFMLQSRQNTLLPGKKGAPGQQP